MSAKTSAARREAFFAALRETGNRTIAAERARVSQSRVTLHRANDPAFKAEIEAAVAEARARLRDAEGMRPDKGWGSLDGEELVVRSTNGRRVQVARARVAQWAPRTEDRFLATLAATCNVKAACAEAGMSQATAYNHYRRWPAFARRWNEALETGALRLEMALLENGGNPFSPDEIVPNSPMPPMTPDQAIHLIHMHQHRFHGIGGKPGRWKPPPSLNDPRIRESILRKFEVLARAWGRNEEE